MGLVALVHSVVNMFSPDKIFTDGDSKNFATVHHFQGIAVYLVPGIDKSPSVWVDPYDSTFLRSELHLPGCFLSNHTSEFKIIWQI